MGNDLVKKVVSTAALITGLSVPLKAADFYLVGNLNISTALGTPIANIKTAPEYVRSVLPHPDDVKLNGVPNVPIIVGDSPESLNSEYIGIEGKVGLGIENNDFKLELGPKMNLSVNGISKSEQDYEPFVYGDAYVYYGLGMGGFNLGGGRSRDVADEQDGETEAAHDGIDFGGVAAGRPP